MKVRGTTLIAGLFTTRGVHIANVGDCRGYSVSRIEERALTQDHSLVNEQIRAGLLTPEEADVSPYKHVVTRALGLTPLPPGVDLLGPIWLKDEWLVFCSDGLHSVIADEEIGEACRNNPPQIACNLLVSKANGRGGPDNISVVVARFDEAVHPPR
jgi:protein phosphatase